MNSSKNISLLVFVTILLFGGFVGLWFLVGDITDRNAHISSVLTDIDGLIKKDQEYQLFEKTVKETEPDRAKLATFLVKKDGLVDFIKLIEGVALSSGVEVSIKTVAESDIPNQASTSPKEVLTLPLSTVGTWENTALFLAMLETLPYKATLTKIDLKKIDATQSDSKKLRFSKTRPAWQGDFEFGVLKFK